LVDPGSAPEHVLPDGEVYLELAHLDLSSADAIIDFVNRYGFLGVYDSEAERWPCFEGLVPIGRELLDRIEPARMRLRPALTEWQEGCAKRLKNGDLPLEARVALEMAIQPLAIHAERAADWVETREEFTLGAQLVHDALHAWLGLLDDAAVGDLPFQSGVFSGAEFDRERGRSARSSLLLTGYLDWFFSIGLTSFRPVIRFEGPERAASSEPAGSITVVETTGRATAPSLFPVCALELFNHVVAQARYHICKNETCGRLFVHQEGRSATGRHRSDSQFHNRYCAKAQAQREYNRRKSARKITADLAAPECQEPQGE
jgi:hypothetical protein